MKPDVFLNYPVVYAVQNDYSIVVSTSDLTVMWITVGNKTYYDDYNGVLKSKSHTHMITIPQTLLNNEKKYTVSFRRVFERPPYYPKTGEVEECSFDFRPVTGDKQLRFYHIADTHGMIESPIQTGRFWNDKLNFLIMNGDIGESPETDLDYVKIHTIPAEITKGEIPVIYSRGNHDTRGDNAEILGQYTPTGNGKTYFTFRLGPIWGLVLDCAEDKPDKNEEYGGVVCCEPFRQTETEFIRHIISNSVNEYDAPDVKYRLVISHFTFSEGHPGIFNIEIETYTEWCRLLKEYVKPDVMICGHMHECYITHEGEPRDVKGQPCPVVVASALDHNTGFFEGAAFEMKDDIRVLFTDNNENILGEETLPLMTR